MTRYVLVKVWDHRQSNAAVAEVVKALDKCISNFCWKLPQGLYVAVLDSDYPHREPANYIGEHI